MIESCLFVAEVKVTIDRNTLGRPNSPATVFSRPGRF